MEYPDLCEPVWAELMPKLFRARIGEPVSPALHERALESAELLLRWCDNPATNFTDCEPDVLGMAQYILATHLLEWSNRPREVPPQYLAAIPIETARNVLRAEIHRTTASARGLH